MVLPAVPHKVVAEVSTIGNLWERLVIANRGWQSESTDGLEGGWSWFLEWLQWWAPGR